MGNFTLSGATPAPATNLTVNGTLAQTYGDLTFAATNLTLSAGQNSFTNIFRNNRGQSSSNVLTANLPLSVSLQSDLDGNLTNNSTLTLLYDAEHRLTNVFLAQAWKSEFVYDGLGRRRIERDYGWTGSWTKTNELRFIYDGFLLIQVRDSNNVPLVTYTRGLDLSGSLAGAGGIGGLLARSDPADTTNGPSYYHVDGSGNVTALIDNWQVVAARYEYGPFLKPVAQWGRLADANEMQGSSMPKHGRSGLVGYPARFYDPGAQRWTTQDSIGEAGGINLYGFVFNSPLNGIDPLGEASGDDDDDDVPLTLGAAHAASRRGASGASAALYNGATAEARKDAAMARAAVEMVPAVGLVNSGYQFGSGKDAMDYHKLSGAERTASGVQLGASVAPVAAKAAQALTKAAKAVEAAKASKACAAGTKEVIRVTGEALEKARKEFNAVKPRAWMEEAARNPKKYTDKQLEAMRVGRAPVGSDNFTMEVHHRTPLAEGGANTYDNFEFLTRTDHRLGENYKLNHPGLP
jgi:RHS repeat-associated protein